MCPHSFNNSLLRVNATMKANNNSILTVSNCKSLCYVDAHYHQIRSCIVLDASFDYWVQWTYINVKYRKLVMVVCGIMWIASVSSLHDQQTCWSSANFTSQCSSAIRQLSKQVLCREWNRLNGTACVRGELFWEKLITRGSFH